MTGIAIPNATVLCTITDSTGAVVAGQAWPVTLAFLNGSNGIYRATLSSTNQFQAGATYNAAFSITVNNVVTNFSYDLYVAQGNTVSQAQPAQAFQAVSLQQRLADAEDAYHQLIMGKGIASVKDQNGEEVHYSITNRAALAQYIFMLQRQLGIAQPAKPATVVFADHRFRPYPFHRRWTS